MGGQNYSQKPSEQPTRESFRVLTSSKDGVDTYANRLVSKLTPEQKQQFEQAKQLGAKGTMIGRTMAYQPLNNTQIQSPPQSTIPVQSTIPAQSTTQPLSGQYLPPILQQPQSAAQSTLQPVTNNSAVNMDGAVDPSKVKQQSAQQIGAATSTTAQPTMTTAANMANKGAGAMQQQTNQFAIPTTNGLKFGGS
jgi:hypothetical protein